MATRANPQYPDLRQTSPYARYLSSLGWQVDRLCDTYCYSKNLPLLGPITKVQRPHSIPPKLLPILQKKLHPFQIFIEPAHHVAGVARFKPCPPFLPTKTQLLNLKLSQKALLAQMHAKTRYNIRLAQKKSFTITLSQDIERFASFWIKQRYTKTSFLFGHPQELINLFHTFGKRAILLLAHQNHQLLAGLLTIHTSHIAYYMYAASSSAGNQLHAPTLLTWQSILASKHAGCTLYDFEGIYDSRFPIASWKGFTRFKKSFGGQEVEYPGCFSHKNWRRILPLRQTN